MLNVGNLGHYVIIDHQLLLPLVTDDQKDFL